jgi:DNA-binding transcriptional regulator LsrR (DeoR family)
MYLLLALVRGIRRSPVCTTRSPKLGEKVLAAGARADVCATLISDKGQVVRSPLDKVGLAINAKQIRRIPEIVGIAGGLEKADAILAALRGNWITTLVTDAGVARRLLE